MILLEDNRKALYQWDLNQRLILTDIEAGTEVQISDSNNTDEYCLTTKTYNENGNIYAKIPNIYLQKSGILYVYIYVYQGDKSYTKYYTEIIVLPRKKPSDYVYTETEVLTYKKLEVKFDQMQGTIGNLADLTTMSKDNLVAAINEVAQTGGAGAGDGGTFEETDPTVPEWAKQPEKPRYTADEVGALPAGTKIPSKTSDLQNDRGFLTEHQDLSGYALKSEVPKSASDVGADAAGTAESKVSEHNVSLDAHNDIRLLVQGLTERLNALADSDDTTLDQMSEVVAYIKSNKSLIDAITKNKVNVSDIIDNLTTNVSNKPLSAAQGVALKALIDAIAVPTKLSELENDSGYAKTTDIPDKLPNPKKITFAGAVTGSYDGSQELTVDIPSGGGSGSESKSFVLLHSLTFEEDTQYVNQGLGGNYEEVLIEFSSLYSVEGKSTSLVVSVNGGRVGNVMDYFKGPSFVNNSSYPSAGIIILKKIENNCIAMIVGRNSGGNQGSAGQGVGIVQKNVSNGIYEVSFALEGYLSNTMNTGAKFDIYAR